MAVSAQTCEEVKKENEYLKHALNITKPQYKVDFDQTEISIIKIEGSIQQQAVTITMLVTNKESKKFISLNDFSAVDLEGNQYEKKIYEEIKGLNSTGSNLFSWDVPVKIQPILINVPASVQYLKLFKFDYYSEVLKRHETLEFRDLKIMWK